MDFQVVFLRVLAFLLFLDPSWGEAPKKLLKPRKYPLQVHHMYREQLRKMPKTVGEWSAWSPWSSCSRSCGGGVTIQSRHCITRPADSRFVRGQRRRRQSWKSGCVGLYKRIHLCNNQDCKGGRDFRYEQCASFNNRPFKGKFFSWEPFLQANDECALNCRAMGMNFYATLNKTVIDGTACSRPMTSMGRAAPRGTRGICIDGNCKSVNSHGVIGSVDDNQEDCSACLKGNCRSISGFYTRPDLPQGYSLITQVPQGACRLLVQQLKHTRNFLAIRDANGTFIINGDWKFGGSRVVSGAGTKFSYIKQNGNSQETITSSGPLANAVDIMIVNYQSNPGVKYGYSIPVDDTSSNLVPPIIRRPPESLEPRRLEPPPFVHQQRDEARPSLHRRSRTRRKYIWKISGLSSCSKSCGGGIQTAAIICVREHIQTPVIDRRCQHLPKPIVHPISCNTQECPHRWIGEWTECSATCGDATQDYIWHCKKDNSLVGENYCPKPKPSKQTRQCNLNPCENTMDNELVPQPSMRVGSKDWTVSPWSPCSVTCGKGHRSRSVTCPSGQCEPDNRPLHAEYCDAGSCEKADHNTWLLSDWSQCSEDCGTGSQTRQAICLSSKCDSKPETSRACSSEKQCSGQWFTGPWGDCSDSCNGQAFQKREVFCIAKIRGQSHITNEMTCSASLKPTDRQSCQGFCPARWFMGDWGACEGQCPTGIQRRTVKCLNIDGSDSTECSSEVPASKRTCACPKKSLDTRDQYRPVHDEALDRSCIDKIRNCHLAVQARLCQYAYYTSHCCTSCKRAQQDLME